MTSPAVTRHARRALRAPGATHDHLLREGILKLLAIKDSDIRLLTLEQCRDAVDKSLHAGGAFSATIPLVTLYYGGFIDVDVADPTRPGQDLFVLSKGHAVAALASIYAELGYFDRSVLRNSRSFTSILNGHPGPILPGIQIATGPMGQGLAVAQGFAIAGRMSPRFDAYALCGDGEMQEGPIWEAVMFAGQKHLDNLCVMVDRNNGQLDMANRMIFPMPDLEAVFSSFNWEVHSVDATQYNGLYAALEQFRFGPRNGKPTAIICHGTKGHGALSDFLNKHKVTVPDPLLEQEMALQAEQRRDRVERIHRVPRQASRLSGRRAAAGGAGGVRRPDAPRRAAQRRRRAVARAGHRPGGDHARSVRETSGFEYDAALLPVLDRAKEYAASDVVTAAMKVFARDPRVVSIDADLATTSGLEAGVAHGRSAARAERRRGRGQHDGHRRGVCRARLQHLDQHLLSVLRLEGPAADRRRPSGAAGSDGAPRRLAQRRARPRSHDAGDRGQLRDAHQRRHAHGQRRQPRRSMRMAHLKIIDVSCPQQMLALMRWVMAGNRGLLYVRVMRTPSAVLYDRDYEFEFGKGAFCAARRPTPRSS